jgi:hypothetical protein
MDRLTTHRLARMFAEKLVRGGKSGTCDLTAVASLPGNWTHGDYVSAVAADGDAAQIPLAAHSDCGKPIVAVGHGGPPAHALEHRAAGKANGGGKADD